ncbi:methylase involved in ubiquinone/menaquinone biosynthesis [Rivularia sp. PCC 7116]|nr:methylase involved in ubiquinone/menaquinone biosynthesis [Rivularia sp. PCC 7116]
MEAMEWTIGWWRVSLQRVYPTATQLSQTYDKAALGWHEHLRLLGHCHAYRQMWKSLKDADILPDWQDNLTGTLKSFSRRKKLLREPLTICDCGIGTAAFSLAFAQTINPTTHITGVDISSGMLEIAHQKLSQTNINHQICQSDVRSLPFADECFDGVISAHVLEHLPNPEQGLKEIVRVLRPGSPLILAVTQCNLLGRLIQWHWGNRCFSQKEVSDLMYKAGLTNIQCFPFPMGLTRLMSFVCIGFRSSMNSTCLSRFE